MAISPCRIVSHSCCWASRCSRITPASSETTWGFEINENYVYELNKLTIFGTPLVFEFKDESRLRVVFNEVNDTGYASTMYNDTHLVDETSTTFLSVPVDNETSMIITNIYFILV